MGWFSRCRDCNVEISIDGYTKSRRLPEDVVAHAWSKEHIRTAASPVNGEQLKYALEREGWNVRYLGVSGRTLCEIRKGANRMRTAFMETQAEAVVAAVAMAAKTR